MILHVISSPRNISTAFMYSFAQRSDTEVMDEPFYANYLADSEAHHPGRDQILSSMEQDFDKVLEQINKERQGNLFVKNMAHHLSDKDLSFLLEWENVILIRDPKQLIASFAQVIPNPQMKDIGVKMQFNIFQYLNKNGKKCIVIDSGELLKNPKEVLSKMCLHLNISFKPEMLSWKKGGIEEDGVWAKHWYKNVHASEGFGVQKTSSRALPEECKELYHVALPMYEQLYDHAIKAENAPTIRS